MLDAMLYALRADMLLHARVAIVTPAVTIYVTRARCHCVYAALLPLVMRVERRAMRR